MACEMLGTTDIAKVVGCTPKKLRAKIASGEWTCARIKVKGKKRICQATISELAKYFELSREEVIRRIEEGGEGHENLCEIRTSCDLPKAYGLGDCHYGSKK